MSDPRVFYASCQRLQCSYIPGQMQRLGTVGQNVFCLNVLCFEKR